MGERSGVEIGQEGQERRVGSSGVSESSEVDRRIDRQVGAHRELKLRRVRDELRRKESPGVLDRVNQDRVEEQTWREENEARPWGLRKVLYKLFGF